MDKRTIQKRGRGFLAVFTAMIIAVQSLVSLASAQIFVITHNTDTTVEPYQFTVSGATSGTCFAYDTIGGFSTMNGESYGSASFKVSYKVNGSRKGDIISETTSHNVQTLTDGETVYRAFNYTAVADSGDIMLDLEAINSCVVYYYYNYGYSSYNSKVYTSSTTSLETLDSTPGTGITFDGWYTESTGGSLVESITESNIANNDSLSLYAHWNNSNTLTFDLKGGSWKTDFTAPSDYIPGNSFSLPSTDKLVPGTSGLVFKGWCTDSECLTAPITTFGGESDVTGAKTLYAKWGEPEAYTISFFINGSEDSSLQQSVYEGQKISAPSVVVNGISVQTWYTLSSCDDDSIYDFDTLVDFSLRNGFGNNILLYAGVKTVKFMVNDEEIVSLRKNVEVNRLIDNPGAINGIYFNDWFKYGSITWSFTFEPVKYDITLYAYTATVKFLDPDTGASLADDQLVGVGNNVTYPGVVSNNDNSKVVSGWFRTNQPEEMTSYNMWHFESNYVSKSYVNGDNNFVLYAKWVDAATTYSVEFYKVLDNNNNKELVTTQTGILVGGKATAPTGVTLHGINIKNWYNYYNCDPYYKWDFSNDVVSNNADDDRVLRLYCKAPLISFCLVDERGYMGEPILTKYVEANELFSNPSPINGVYYEKWGITEGRYNFDFGLHYDAIIYSWDGIFEFRDTDANNTLLAQQTVGCGSCAVEPNLGVVNNKVVVGWYKNKDLTDDSEWDFDTEISERKTVLYAKWAEVQWLTVNLDGNGATKPGTASVEAIIDQPMPTPITLPEKTGYTFAGYYRVEKDNNNVITSYDKQFYTSTGASANAWDDEVGGTLYAKWIKNEEQVNNENNPDTKPEGNTEIKNEDKVEDKTEDKTEDKIEDEGDEEKNSNPLPEKFKKLEQAEPGDKIEFNMYDDPILPKSVIDEIKGKDITIVLDMGNGITWTINGLTVTESIGDIDMSVKIGGDEVPIDVINMITGKESTIVLTIAHSGELGFEAVLTIDLDEENKGYYANLFYYNAEEEDLEFVCYGIIGEDGKVELTFTHCSSYVIVIDDHPLDGSYTEDSDLDDEDEDENGGESNVDVDVEDPGNPDTGVAAGLGAAIISAGAIYLAKKKRK